ncbi:MAG: PadR family transcriptional regulator [Clostridia bacterium]|nr:PadR family transcriptional regulator [Clostridia bacterium]MDR3644745.1 PadR family transcriptional regulator [Clostridia bacterium]
MNDESEIINGLLLELRRGMIILSVLSQLDTPKYGYSLMQSLEEKGVPVDAGTLYPLLRRLEKQELLHSEWEVGGTKPRKYYSLSETGKAVYGKLCDEWIVMAGNMDKLINRKGDGPDGVD